MAILTLLTLPYTNLLPAMQDGTVILAYELQSASWYIILGKFFNILAKWLKYCGMFLNKYGMI